MTVYTVIRRCGDGVFGKSYGSSSGYSSNQSTYSSLVSRFAFKRGGETYVDSGGDEISACCDGVFQLTSVLHNDVPFILGYVNDGFLLDSPVETSIACEAIDRFMSLSGIDVFFLSGTDEHGQKVTASAKTKGI